MGYRARGSLKSPKRIVRPLPAPSASCGRYQTHVGYRARGSLKSPKRIVRPLPAPSASCGRYQTHVGYRARGSLKSPKRIVRPLPDVRMVAVVLVGEGVKRCSSSGSQLEARAQAKRWRRRCRCGSHGSEPAPYSGAGCWVFHPPTAPSARRSTCRYHSVWGSQGCVSVATTRQHHYTSYPPRGLSNPRLVLITAATCTRPTLPHPADNKRSLELDYSHWAEFQPTLSIWVADAPRQMLEYMDEAATEVG